jgi:hypothetical protein
MVCILPGQGGRGKCSVAISFIEEGVAATCGSQPPVEQNTVSECDHHMYIVEGRGVTLTPL